MHFCTLAILALYKRFTSSIKIIRPDNVCWWYKLIWFAERYHSLFSTAKNELSNISHWFNDDKLSLNADKTKFTLSHKVRKRDKIPLVSTLKINSTFIKRADHITFLGVLFDENLTWKNHINLTKDEISKNVGILYRAKSLLNQKSRKKKGFFSLYMQLYKL